ncbi:MAG: 7-cyano-7-deazaguanine synthase [Thaumarchaeota archaeon]|nr:7-cyano-7-deazaguanine synthase [Nitrososphaerota archaeon]
MDSATCLFLSKKKGNRNRALTVMLHGMAEGELRAATAIARRAGVLEHRFFSVPELRELGDMRTPRRLAGMPRAYIPMKNAIYYSVAASFAEEVGATRLIGGHNLDDKGVYEDTSERFFASMQSALREGSERLRAGRLSIWRPLRRLDKAAVVTMAAELGVPLELTWSCHREGTKPCWRCSGCIQRKKAFREAGIADPLVKRPV